MKLKNKALESMRQQIKRTREIEVDIVETVVGGGVWRVAVPWCTYHKGPMFVCEKTQSMKCYGGERFFFADPKDKR